MIEPDVLDSNNSVIEKLDVATEKLLEEDPTVTNKVKVTFHPDIKKRWTTRINSGIQSDTKEIN